MMEDQYSRYRSMSQQANPYNDLPEQPAAQTPQRAAIGNVIGSAAGAMRAPTQYTAGLGSRGTAPAPYMQQRYDPQTQGYMSSAMMNRPQGRIGGMSRSAFGAANAAKRAGLAGIASGQMGQKQQFDPAPNGGEYGFSQADGSAGQFQRKFNPSANQQPGTLGPPRQQQQPAPLGYEWYSPPMPTAPPGYVIPQVMPQPRLRNIATGQDMDPFGKDGPLGQGPMNLGGQMLPPQAQAGQTPAAQGGLGAFGGKLEGFDMNKMNSGHNSPKYQFGRVMSQFDPKGGITQDMLNALNALGLGQVSGRIGGDKLSIGGNIDPRFQGVTEFDVIRDLENGGGWQWGGLNGSAQDGGGGMQAVGGMEGMLGSLLGQHGGSGMNVPAMGGNDYSNQIMQYLMKQLAINKTLGGQ